MSEEGYRRRLAALLSADVEGYSRLMREDEDTTIRTVTEYRAAITDLVRRYRGRVVDSPGDNILAEFGSVVDAVNCAVEIQRDLAERNLELAENRRMKWRIGINSGDVVQDGERIYGDGVNVAARMESLAEGGGICLSGTVYDSIVNKLGLEYEYLGEQAVKNIAQPIRAYRVLSYPGAAAHRVLRAKKAEGKRWRNIAMAVAALVVVLAAVVVWQVFLRSTKPKPVAVKVKALPLPDKPSVAVLPFVNTSGDPKQNFLGDGITDHIIYALSRVPGLFVIARHSSFTYKGKSVKVQRVGRELGVRYVVEGSVSRAGDKVRITAQLIDAQTGGHLWSASYDRKLKDIFALQSEITLKIITSIGAKLTQGERVRLLAKGTTNLEALLLVMKGHAIFDQATPAATRKARQLALRAIKLDPNYPGAYCLLGRAYFMRAHYTHWKTALKYWKKSADSFKKALTLDRNHSAALAYLGYVYLWGFRLREKGLALAERAVVSSPGNADAYLIKGVILNSLYRPHEGLQEMMKGMRMNPKPPMWYLQFLSWAYLMTGQYEKAIVAAKKAHVLAPYNSGNQWTLMLGYYLMGRKREAQKWFAAWRKLTPFLTINDIIKRCVVKNKSFCIQRANTLRKLGLK